MSRRAQLVASLFLAVFGILLAAATLEIGVRALHLVPASFWEHDDLVGARLIPNMSGWWTQEEHEFTVPVHINSLGFHDVEHPLQKPANSERVLLIGDSFVEALHVPLEASIGRQLEARLRDVSTPAEVVSAGVSGYGTAGELLYYRDRGWKLEPDLVLLAFYPGNDIKNNSPVFEKALTPEYAADGSLKRIDAGKPKSRRTSLLNHSAAYKYVRKLILTQHPGMAQFLVKLGLMKKGALISVDARGGVPVDYWVYADPPPPEWRDAWTHTERLLDDFRTSVTAHGSRFALLIVTARDVLYPSAWQALEKTYPQIAQHKWNFDQPTQRVLAWCHAHDVPCLDLMPAFAAARDAGAERLHYVYDGHWTAAGHALAAKSAAAFIARDSLL